jgi:hypothetical protein
VLIQTAKVHEAAWLERAIRVLASTAHHPGAQIRPTI